MKHFPQPQLSRRGTSRWLLPVLGLAAFGAAMPEKAGAQTRIGAPQRLSALIEAPSPILISELRPGGPKGAQDAFVELFNSTSQPISLAGWTLRFRISKEAVANVEIAPGTRIEARGHLLLAARDYSLGALAKADGQWTAPIKNPRSKLRGI